MQKLPGLSTEQFAALQSRYRDHQDINAFNALAVAAMIEQTDLVFKMLASKYPQALDEAGDLRPNWAELIVGPL